MARKKREDVYLICFERFYGLALHIWRLGGLALDNAVLLLPKLGGSFLYRSMH